MQGVILSHNEYEQYLKNARIVRRLTELMYHKHFGNCDMYHSLDSLHTAVHNILNHVPCKENNNV